MLISYAATGLPQDATLEKAFNMAAANMTREFNRRKPAMYQEGLNALKREEQQLELAFKKGFLPAADYQMSKAHLLSVIDEYKANFDNEASKVVKEILDGTVERTKYFAAAGQARSVEAVASLFLDASHTPKELAEIRENFGDTVADIVTDFIYFKASQLDNDTLALMSPSSRNILMVGNIKQMLAFEKPFDMMRRGEMSGEEQAIMLTQFKQFVSGLVTQIQKAELTDKEVMNYVVDNFNTVAETVRTNIRLQIKDNKIFAIALPVKATQSPAMNNGDAGPVSPEPPKAGQTAKPAEKAPPKPTAKPVIKPNMGGKPPMG
jgi:hypothetical protein